MHTYQVRRGWIVASTVLCCPLAVQNLHSSFFNCQNFNCASLPELLLGCHHDCLLVSRTAAHDRVRQLGVRWHRRVLPETGRVQGAPPGALQEDAGYPTIPSPSLIRVCYKRRHKQAPQVCHHFPHRSCTNTAAIRGLTCSMRFSLSALHSCTIGSPCRAARAGCSLNQSDPTG